MTTNVCDCGCGQAPSTTTRLRKAECPKCGAVIRASRLVIRDALPVCGRCETDYRPACLYDARLVGQVETHPVFLRLVAKVTRWISR